MIDPRITELLTLAQEEGLTLPLPAETIIALEDVGCVVDLATGAILIGEADRAYIWELTPAGEAMAHLIKEDLL